MTVFKIILIIVGCIILWLGSGFLTWIIVGFIDGYCDRSDASTNLSLFATFGCASLIVMVIAIICEIIRKPMAKKIDNLRDRFVCIYLDKHK